MTAHMDMRAANTAVRTLFGPVVERFVEEERELRRRLEAIGPMPGWWRPFARRAWRDTAKKIHYGWACWCLSQRFGIKWTPADG